MTLKNITLSADEKLIQLAREKAIHEKKSLNTVFREWLVRYTENSKRAKNYRTMMKNFSYVTTGKHFSRDDLMV